MKMFFFHLLSTAPLVFLYRTQVWMSMTKLFENINGIISRLSKALIVAISWIFIENASLLFLENLITTMNPSCMNFKSVQSLILTLKQGHNRKIMLMATSEWVEISWLWLQFCWNIKEIVIRLCGLRSLIAMERRLRSP